MDTIPLFYVYVLARPNGRAFYVGKGTGDRIYKHEAEAKRGCICYKCRVIRKIWRGGGEIQRYTVFTTNIERDALNYECELIKQYGRENLTNVTDGGEGMLGVKRSQESIRKQVETRKGYKHSAETLEKLSKAAQNKSVEHRRKIAESNRGRKHSEEAKHKMSQKQKGRIITEETKRKMSAASKGVPKSEEQRARLIEMGRKVAERQRGTTLSDETKQRMSDGKRASWARKRSAQ
jgi:hypothetical protein